MTGSRADRATIDRRRFILGAAMCGAAGLTYARMPHQVAPAITEKRFTSLVPDRVAEWEFETSSGLILPPPDALSDRLYDNLVTRIYGSDRHPSIMLVVAYNPRQDGVLQIHRPEFCYGAGGFTLTPTRPLDIALGPQRTLPCQAFIAQGQFREEIVTYWTRVGEAFPRSWREQRLSVARANLLGFIPDGILVRVSVIGNDLQESLPSIQRFIASLNISSQPEFRRLLFG